MMIKKKNLDFSIVKRRLDENNLNRFASVLFGFIFANYDLDESKKELIKNELDLDLSLYKEEDKWPYDESVALSIKKQDLKERLENGQDISRLYLFPVAIFKDFWDVDDSALKEEIQNKYNLEKMYDNIYKVEIENISFIILGMGIFIDTYADVSHIGRKGVREIIARLLKELEVKEVVEIPYALDMMEEWYF